MNQRKNITKILLLLILSVFSIGTFNSKPAMAVSTAQPYMGQISLFAFGFAPRGWAECAGQTLPIQQNQALYSLIGNNFGGNGSTTFQLPNLSNISPIPNAKYYIALEGFYPSHSSSQYDYGGEDDITGAISIFPYDFEPSGWVRCNGQNLEASKSGNLNALIGNTYGGTESIYKVPNLGNSITTKYVNGSTNSLGYYICVNGNYPVRDSGPNGEDLVGTIDLYAFKFDQSATQVVECDGQTSNIATNSTLFNFIHTTYGGNGASTFGIPDLRGAVPLPNMGYYITAQGDNPSQY